MKIINIHEAKTQLSALLTEIEKTGEKIIICRHGKPVADLIPHRKRSRLQPHPVMRNVCIAYDPTEPLGKGEWPENGQ